MRRASLAPVASTILALLTVAFAGGAAADHDHGSTPPAAASTAPAPRITGLGPIHHPVATRVAEAQQYFDQGLGLCFAFNHDEAIRAFRHAAALDPSLAMAHWGIALALGPNINLPMDSANEPVALEAGTTSRRSRSATASRREPTARPATRHTRWRWMRCGRNTATISTPSRCAPNR